MRHLLDIDGLERDEIVGILDTADSMQEVLRRDIPKVPALQGKTVVSLFYEDSTRTRLSFETAAKRLSADTSLEILIKTLADTSGADAVQKALDRTKGEVSKELAIKDRYCDVALKVDGSVRLLVEAKAASLKAE